jgi:hypothetical protein
MRPQLTSDGQICLPILELWLLQEFGKFGADVTVSEVHWINRAVAAAAVHARRGRFNREFVDYAHMLQEHGETTVETNERQDKPRRVARHRVGLKVQRVHENMC